MTRSQATGASPGRLIASLDALCPHLFLVSYLAGTTSSPVILSHLYALPAHHSGPSGWLRLLVCAQMHAICATTQVISRGSPHLGYPSPLTGRSNEEIMAIYFREVNLTKD